MKKQVLHYIVMAMLMALPQQIMADDVIINSTNFPDDNFRNIILSWDIGKDGVLTDDEIASVNYIDVVPDWEFEENPKDIIVDLKGIEYFTSLESLVCWGNELTTLDVSKNTALNYLDCMGNKLTSLDVSGCKNLTYLDCYSNQLTSLDVSKNTALEDLNCSWNQLTTLDVSKKAELWDLDCYNNQLTSLNITGCTALDFVHCYNNRIKGAAMDALIAGLSETGGYFYAISPDDSSEQNVVTKAQVEAAKEKGWRVLAWDCENSESFEYEGSDPVAEGIAIDANSFPDINFRRWILTQDYGSDGVLTDEEIANVTEINVDGKNIASLKGIEYFTALEELVCSENKLSTLDVSKNTALTVLYCNDNQLTSLNVSGCTALTWLYCQYNNLTALDMSKNTALKELYCHGNLLTALNVSGCKALTRLECEDNKLTTLNVSGCTALVWLDCGGNNLTSLNVSKNTALEWLACDYNQLASLDVSKNKTLTGLYCSANKIKGTEMDALIAGLQEKGGSFYAISPDFNNEQNVVTKAQVATAKKKRWTTYYYSDESEHWFEYEGSNDQTISPVNEGETIDIGSEIDANTNLNGNVVGDVYYNISSGNGSYNTAEGCITVTKPTDDNAIDGQDIFSDDFQDNYTGIVFIVPSGNGTIKVEAQTTGSLVLKVKIGDNAPREMVLNDKEKASFPYNVSEDTFVYIYAGAKAAGAKGMRKASGNGELKIYGIEIVSGTDSLDNLTISQLDDSPVYNLNGQKVDGMPTNKGIYIKDGKKVLVK